MADEATRTVEGGPAQPVYIVNNALPSSAPTGTQNVTVVSALPAGTNNIGDVDIASALPAGDNNIGNVDIVTLPAIPAGTNNIGGLVVAGTALTAAGDGKAAATNLPSANHVYNGTSWYAQRGNMGQLVFAITPRTASVASGDMLNINGRGIIIAIKVTAITGAPSIQVVLYGRDALMDANRIILISAAITAVGTTFLRVYPGLTAAANLTANDLLEYTWSMEVAHANADSITYGVGATLMV